MKYPVSMVKKSILPAAGKVLKICYYVRIYWYDPSNYGIVDLLFGKSGVNGCRDKDLKDEPGEFGGLTIYDINDL